jgi:hypothetical protein
MLRCVPGVSQDAAGRLVDRFKTLPALQRALAAETPFPKVQLSHGQCLGKTRLKRLCCYLLEEQLEANAQHRESHCMLASARRICVYSRQFAERYVLA